MDAIRTAALDLTLQERRDLSLALLWSLPRDDVIALNETISQSLQKDIVGCLPPELAIHVLAYLELEDILRCTQVSAQWAKLCRDQSLWASLCLSHSPRIQARHTTWSDVTTHQQLMHLSDPYVQSDKDEGAFESGFEDLSFHTDIGGVGVSADMPASPGLGSSTMSMRGGLRGLVWERSGSGLPMHVASGSRGNTPRKNRFSLSLNADMDDTDTSEGINIGKEADGVDTFRKALEADCPLSSHLNEPTAQPSVNYKHLYIAHAILARRLRAGQGLPKLMPGTGHAARQPQLVRPRVIDAISSIEAGGLPGHAETVYALQLVSRRMTIQLVQFGPDGHPSRAHTPTPFDQPPLTPQKAQARTITTVTGRDWLISSSRDHTLRLWHLSCPKPHVVKMFTEGHVGSVLCLAVVDVAVKEVAQAAPVSPRFRTRRRSLRPVKTRPVALSGGSDGRLCLWDIENGDGRPKITSEQHSDAILCVKADEERVVTSSKDRTIRVHDVQTLEQLLLIDCTQEGLHRGAINSVCLTKDYIGISASGDKTIRVWCIHTGAQLTEIEAGDRGIASMDFSPALPGSALRGTIVAGSSDASIKVFHLVAVIRQHEHGVDLVDALDMIPPRRDMTLREMLEHEDTNEFDMSASVEGSNWETTSIATSITRVSLENDQDNDHSYENSHGHDHFHGHNDNDGDHGGHHGAAYDNDTSSSRHRPSLPLEELRIEPAGRCWAACNCPPGMNKSDSALCRRCCNRGHTDLVRSVCFGETVVLSGSYDSTVKVWDRTTGQLLANLSGVHSGRIFSVVGDRMRIVSSGLDSRISIWDFAEGIDTSFVEP